MSEYFDKFPKTLYNIDRNIYKTPNFNMPVNILVRVGVLMSKLDQVFHYYDYQIKEGETPEIIAEKFYGNAEAHWLILLTNKIMDPQYDWVLHYDAFSKYIINKYGSIDTSKITIHHYELVQKIQDVETDTLTYRPYEVSSDKYAELVSGGTPVSEPNNYTVYTVGGKQVRIFPQYLRTIYAYDWEFDRNEERRNIKLIKSSYYEAIVAQFDDIMLTATGLRRKPGIRNLR